MPDQSQTKEHNWKNTSILGIILVASDLLVLYFGNMFLDHHSIWIIAASGIMTFFGILMISSYHKKNFEDHNDKGTMRDAITGSLISVYFIILGLDWETNVQTSSDPILNNFTSVIIILVAFYFGSKVVTEVSGKTQKNSDKGK